MFHSSVFSNCELNQGLHGLSGVGIDYPSSSWPSSGSET